MSQNTARLSTALADRYKIERHLGEGGMATVYLAEDLKHKRKVAVKVLRPELAAVLGAERFVQEITTTANLQHPHILPLFDSGEADSFLYYVMPFIDGETLRDKLNRETQLGIEEAVRITTDVADALDYAHRNNVIHRDIKPENILLHDGRPMVADFGIALAVSAAAGGRMTETGLSLGTPHYMSPEQATAEKDLTNRSDIYSLGSVLYEMLTGSPPHVGSSAQQIIMKIVTDEARPITELRKSVPPHVAVATAKALEKLPADRFTGAQDFAKALADEHFRYGEVAAVADGGAVGLWKRRTAVATILAATFAVVATASLLRLDESRSSDSRTTYLTLASPPDVSLTYSWGSTVAISPDGRRLVYVGSPHRFYLQDLDQPGSAIPIPGTEGATVPFFSPDGEWIAFAAGGGLRKISLQGGDPVDLAEAVAFRGGAFSPDGRYVYYNRANDSGIWRVPSEGGESESITTPRRDEFDYGHYWPDILPGGDRLLYTSCCERPRIMALDIATGEASLVYEGAVHARYVPTGHLVFAQGSSLIAASFNPGTLEVGAPVTIRDDLVTDGTGGADFALSAAGSLAYLSGTSAFERVLVRFDRFGAMVRLAPQPRHYATGMSFEPGGRRLAIAIRDRRLAQDIYIYDLDRDDFEPFVTDPHNDYQPLWSPDGEAIAFSSTRSGKNALWIKSVHQSGEAELLWESDHVIWPLSWSPDGDRIALVMDHPETREDVWTYFFDGDSATATLAESYGEWSPAFSPDGLWFAYSSNESGRHEIYVMPTAGEGRPCKVSTTGGIEVFWSDDGNGLFFRGSREDVASGAWGVEFTTAMFVDVQDRDFCNTEPVALFDGLEAQKWVVSPDGEFFVGLQPRDPPRLELVENFFEELKAKVGN